MKFDVVQAVKEGKGLYDWATVTAEHKGHKLKIYVFRDAMKFDDIPEMAWDFKVLDEKKRYNGVRLPASAEQLQQIADLLGCRLMTAKVIEMLWLQSKIHFNPICTSGSPRYTIAAICNITLIHQLIEEEIQKAGGDDGKSLIDCVGKFWTLCKDLDKAIIVEGDFQAFNYGWPDEHAPSSRKGIFDGVRVWQPLAGKHNKKHWDPSQTIRLMYQWGSLLRAGETEWTDILLDDVLRDLELAPLLSHEGVLSVFRQTGVPNTCDVVFLPIVEIFAGT